MGLDPVNTRSSDKAREKYLTYSPVLPCRKMPHQFSDEDGLALEGRARFCSKRISTSSLSTDINNGEVLSMPQVPLPKSFPVLDGGHSNICSKRPHPRLTAEDSNGIFDADGRCTDSSTTSGNLSENEARQSPPRTPVDIQRIVSQRTVPLSIGRDECEAASVVYNENKKSPRSLRSFVTKECTGLGGSGISTSKLDKQSGRTTLYSDRFIPSRATTRYALLSPNHLSNGGGATSVARDLDNLAPAAIDGEFFNPNAQINYSGAGVRRGRNFLGSGTRRRLADDFEDGLPSGAQGSMGRMNLDDSTDDFGNNDGPATTSAGGGNGSSASSNGGNGMGSGTANNELHLNVLLQSELLGPVDYRRTPGPTARIRTGGNSSRQRANSFRRGAYNFDSDDPSSDMNDTRQINGINPVDRYRIGGSQQNLLQFQSPYRLNREEAVEMGDSTVRIYDENFHSGGRRLPFLPSYGANQLLSSSSRLLSGMTDSNYQHLAASLGQRGTRRIPKIPFKVLDAPSLQDDFYLNLVDWSSLNVLAVGLGSCVYLWSAFTSKVTKLCDLSESDDSVTSVSWTQRGTHLSVGTNLGEVQLWDVSSCKKIRTMGGHTARVGTMAWNEQHLASGSRDRSIYLRDVRCDEPYTSRLTGHKQEICGLKWSFDEVQLASGGNDNKLFVWDLGQSQPVAKFVEHTAAVKAIAWSPHQHGLLASGGGTADRCIRFWNTLSNTCLNCIDTGSQVCNLMWSKNCNELVSTHGYSLNQIILWRYPSMTKVATLTGHTYRVLYLAMSPDGSTIVTGAGDETLRFWQTFPGPRSHDKGSGHGLLFPSSPYSVIR